ncbi:hypothetical protein AC579_7 [Pseudocercospora musae]|uniref:Uncharacterized protein n=1 Tax=Pseudocercospora musae TaxID=113226 RepID=A0A139I8A3_9PEZI|nr:hypothetical protein AC579_7 [Pseudocercospora musae]
MTAPTLRPLASSAVSIFTAASGWTTNWVTQTAAPSTVIVTVQPTPGSFIPTNTLSFYTGCFPHVTHNGSSAGIDIAHCFHTSTPISTTLVTSSTPPAPTPTWTLPLDKWPSHYVKKGPAGKGCLDWSLPDPQTWTWSEDELDSCPVPTPISCTFPWLLEQPGDDTTFNPQCVDLFYRRHACTGRSGEVVLDASRNYCLPPAKDRPKIKPHLAIQVASNHAEEPSSDSTNSDPLGEPYEHGGGLVPWTGFHYPSPVTDGSDPGLRAQPYIQNHKIVRPGISCDGAPQPDCPFHKTNERGWRTNFELMTEFEGKQCWVVQPERCVVKDGGKKPKFCDEIEDGHWTGICPYPKADGSGCERWWEKTPTGGKDRKVDLLGKITSGK